MTRDYDVDDLRDLLVRESRDVEDSDRFLLRLADTAPGYRRDARRSRMAAVAAAVAVVLAAAVVPWRHAVRSDAPSPVAGPRTAHLMLRHLPHLRVSSAQVVGDREVLQVVFEPTDDETYVGGAVTLYGPGVFQEQTFVPSGGESLVGGRATYVGSYPFLGRDGSVSTVAWPVGGDRWVSVQNVHGPDDSTKPSAIRTRELAIARAVVVR